MLIDQLENGLVVIVEPIESVASVSLKLSLIGGTVFDDVTHIGSSQILGELTTYSTKNYDSRQLADALDLNGIAHSVTVSNDLITYSLRTLPAQLNKAFELLSQMILHPRLEEAQIDNIKSNLKQELSSLKDNPARRARIELNKIYFNAPYNRSNLPEFIGIDNTDINVIKKLYNKYYSPKGSILSIAGNIDEKVVDIIKKYFSDWEGEQVGEPEFLDVNKSKFNHIQEDSAQLQIALAFPAAKFGDPDYYVNKIASEILSGGMFGRLFIEVREKRGLCYSVYGTHSSNNHYGQFFLYAGTTPERAHDTLSVSLDTIKSLTDNLTENELKRAKINYLSGLLLSEESVSSRANSNLIDYLLSKRIRELSEIENKINSVTIPQIQELLNNSKINDYSLVTIGSRNIKG